MDTESGNAQTEEKPIKAVLTITLLQDQTIKVEGPISDKFISYGMLESAKDAIFETHFMNRLKPKNGNGILNFARRFK